MHRNLHVCSKRNHACKALQPKSNVPGAPPCGTPAARVSWCEQSGLVQDGRRVQRLLEVFNLASTRSVGRQHGLRKAYSKARKFGPRLPNIKSLQHSLLVVLRSATGLQPSELSVKAGSACVHFLIGSSVISSVVGPLLTPQEQKKLRLLITCDSEAATSQSRPRTHSQPCPAT